MSADNPNPFGFRGVLALVVLGTVLFMGLLWMIGSGMTQSSANDGGAHVGGKGLNGYAALSNLMEKRGYAVRRAMNVNALDDAGLLVLSPPSYADGAELEKIVSARRTIGPTLIITPKWQAGKLPGNAKGAKEGWVQLYGVEPASWQGFLDDVTLDITPMRAQGNVASWSGAGLQGALPVAEQVLSGKGPRLEPLVIGDQDGRILAAYIRDDGQYPALEDMAVTPPTQIGEDEDVFPLVVVFEPDLLNNYGMADAANARLAQALITATDEYGDKKITFDLTLNGYARSANLLTLAFTPPFLAATLCLLMAALVVGWRAFLRFGSGAQGGRAIAFGKRALVANAAGLISRTGRLHLVAAPFATAARDRLAKALALPRNADNDATEAAIDRALAGRNNNAKPFSAIAKTLRAARRPQQILAAAQDLHALERTLTR